MNGFGLVKATGSEEAKTAEPPWGPAVRIIDLPGSPGTFKGVSGPSDIGALRNGVSSSSSEECLC